MRDILQRRLEALLADQQRLEAELIAGRTNLAGVRGAIQVVQELLAHAPAVLPPAAPVDDDSDPHHRLHI